jgi:AcrR family transcriptional regulator
VSPSAAEERSRVARAIVDVIGTEGYRAASVETIAARAGVAPGAVTGTFGDKADCYFTVYEELRADFLKLTAAAFGSGADWRDALRRTGYAAFEYFESDEPRARFLVLEILEAGDRGAATLDASLELLVELVDAGRFELEDPASVPRSTAEGIVGSFWAMLAQRVREGDMGAADSVVPQLMYIATRPYLGEEIARVELDRQAPELERL